MSSHGLPALSNTQTTCQFHQILHKTALNNNPTFCPCGQCRCLCQGRFRVLKPEGRPSDKLIPGMDTDPFVPSGVLGVTPAAVGLPIFLVLRLPCSIREAEAPSQRNIMYATLQVDRLGHSLHLACYQTRVR